MQVAIHIADEKQLQQFEALRGDKSAQEFAAECFGEGLKLAEFRLHQQRAAAQVGKHPLLQFPETKSEFRDVPASEIEAVLKDKDEKNPIAIEVQRLVSAYLAQLHSYAAQNGNRFPAAVQVKVETPIQQIALKISLAALKNAMQKSANVKTAA